MMSNPFFAFFIYFIVAFLVVWPVFFEIGFGGTLGFSGSGHNVDKRKNEQTQQLRMLVRERIAIENRKKHIETDIKSRQLLTPLEEKFASAGQTLPPNLQYRTFWKKAYGMETQKPPKNAMRNQKKAFEIVLKTLKEFSGSNQRPFGHFGC
jgi:hypothetical protein